MWELIMLQKASWGGLGAMLDLPLHFGGMVEIAKDVICKSFKAATN